jgi:predicted metal-dependent phosphoesterase TrpH
MELDLHIHTRRYSGCSNIAPEDLLARAKAAGLDGIAITEHGIRWSDEEIHRLKAQAGLEDFVVIPGQEVACYGRDGRFEGEFLVFGYPKSLGSSKSLQQVAACVHDAGGVMIAAHPFRRTRDGGFFGSGHQTLALPIDGLEVEHPAYDDEGRCLARAVMAARAIAGIGASDAHDLREIGRCRTVLDSPIASTGMLCEAIRRCRLKAQGARARD